MARGGGDLALDYCETYSPLTSSDFPPKNVSAVPTEVLPLLGTQRWFNPFSSAVPTSGQNTWS